MAYNVLIVDDSSIVRKVLMKTFSMTEIPVNTFYQAEHGLAALEILKDAWIDIIFLDINMPVMNGMEFIVELAKDPITAAIPVVVVSTEGSIERKDIFEKHKVKAYLRKPVSPELLVSTITKIFEGISDE